MAELWENIHRGIIHLLIGEPWENSYLTENHGNLHPNIAHWKAVGRFMSYHINASLNRRGILRGIVHHMLKNREKT